MMDYRKLYRQAILKADKIRKQLKVAPTVPISIYDVAQKKGVEVRFANIPSLEGVYSFNPGPAIFLGSDRPIGRQSFNCAHELGHHVFGHGAKADKIDSERKTKDPDEFLADSFAGIFLMPQLAILRAFKERGFQIKSATPEQIYQVANYFEVGYATLINHLAYGLRLITNVKAEELLKVQPKKIKKEVFFLEVNSEIVVADQHWKARAIDIRMDDYIISPYGTICKGKGIKKIIEQKNGVVFQGICASPTSRLINEQLGWCQFVRVMPRKYEGLAEYRHMEEPDDSD